MKIMTKSVFIQRLNQFLLVVALTVFGISVNQCAKEKEITEAIIAKVGEYKITVNEFNLFYELDPNFGIDSSGLPALRDELDKYINQILAGSRAYDNLLFEDPVLSKALAWEKRMAMLRQLYREVVTTKIIITEDEIEKEYKKANSTVHLRHLFTEDFETAHSWYLQLQTGSTFEQLAMDAFNDSLLAKNGGDLGWLSLRDFDDDFAHAAENLKKNEISRPIKTQWGYHIIQLLDRRDQLLINPNEYNRQKLSLEKKIRQKKSKKLAQEYISSYIGEMNPQPNRQSFLILLNAILPPDEQEKSEYSHKIIVTRSVINSLRTKLANYESNVLIAYQGGSIILGQYLDALENIPASNRPAFKSPGQLSNQLGIWIRDELLYKEAKSRNLDNHARVQSDLGSFVNQQSYYYYLNEIKANLEVPVSVKNYYLSNDKSENSLRIILGRHHTLEEWKFWRAESGLHKNLRTTSDTIRIDEQVLFMENEKIDWDRRIRMFMIRKPS